MTNITYLTDPDQRLDLAGVENQVVVALGAGNTITNTGYSSQTSNETIYLEGNNQTYTAYPSRNSIDHVSAYANNDTINITCGNIDYWGDGGTVISSGFRIADSQYSMGQTDIVAHGTGSLYAVATGTLNDGGSGPPIKFGGTMNFLGGEGYYVIDGRDAHVTNIDLGQGGGVAAGGAERAPYTLGNDWSGTSTLKAGTGDQTSILYGAQHGDNTLITTGHAWVGMEGGQYANNVLDASQSTADNWLEGYQGPATTDPTTTHGHLGNTRIMAGHGNDIIVPGTGNNTMIAGSGQDNFLIFNDAANQVTGGNTEFVQGFKQGTDHVGLWGFSGSTEDILARAQHLGGSTTLTLENGLHLTTAGVTLTAADVWRAG